MDKRLRILVLESVLNYGHSVDDYHNIIENSDYTPEQFTVCSRSFIAEGYIIPVNTRSVGSEGYDIPSDSLPECLSVKGIDYLYSLKTSGEILAKE